LDVSVWNLNIENREKRLKNQKAIYFEYSACCAKTFFYVIRCIP
jgi:hypothetical protein